jgi:hydroxyacylglutathione hydrolase
MILEYFVSGPFQNNVIIVGCETTKKAIIVDPAFNSSQIIDKLLLKHKINPIGIYLTHSHWDHIANCNIVKKKYQIPLFVHVLDSKNVENPGIDKVPLLMSVESTKVDGFIQDNEKIKVGTLEFEVIFTPGHSPGGVCFYEKKHQLLISGDTLFKGTMGSLSLPTSNKNDMLQSLNKLSKLPPNTRVIPGHGDITTIKEERWLANLDQIFS